MWSPMRYVYGMRSVGFGQGNQPDDGLLEHFIDMTETFYDILVYERELSHYELWKYDLEFMAKYKEKKGKSNKGA